MSERKETTRREMICSVGRYVALSGLVLGAARLVGGSKNANGQCVRQYKCTRCGVVAECQLPEGIAARLGKTTG